MNPQPTTCEDQRRSYSRAYHSRYAVTVAATAVRKQDVRREVTLAGGIEALARRIAASESADAWCWLDGAAPAPGERAVSYLGIATEVIQSERGRERDFLTRITGDTAPSRDEGFFGGWVVALGYEFGVALLGLRPALEEVAAGFAMRMDVVLAVPGESSDGVRNSAEDAHGTKDVRGELRGPSHAAIDAWLARYGDLLLGGSIAAPTPDTPLALEATPHWGRTDTEYAAEVAACKRAIREGDAYVLCLTDAAEVAGTFEPFELFLRLRASGAASRGAVLVTPGRSLVTASPERFLTVQGRRVATHPIKGTRPRGATPVRDLALASDLAQDPKERAENLMIVDLMRNDLARVCLPGSVRVTGFLRVETHPHVHQLVSTVSGLLAPENGVADLVAAAFPGGSMTGAPKRRAVEILSELERRPRGLYAGCFGWIDRSGDAELAMSIRGIELREGRAIVGAGGGITADSALEHEVAEKHLKAAALFAALRRDASV